MSGTGLRYPSIDGLRAFEAAARLGSFDRLQKRGRLTSPLEIRHAAVEFPATFFAFDLLALEGYDLRALALIERKALLRDVLPAAGALRFSDHVEAQGEEFFAELMKLRLEGMVAKKADALYRGGRSANWVKIRADRADDFVIVGFTRPKGARTGFGAVHVADFVDGELTYGGRAGSGLTAKLIAEMATRPRAAPPSFPRHAPPDAPAGSR